MLANMPGLAYHIDHVLGEIPGMGSQIAYPPDTWYPVNALQQPGKSWAPIQVMPIGVYVLLKEGDFDIPVYEFLYLPDNELRLA